MILSSPWVIRSKNRSKAFAPRFSRKRSMSSGVVPRRVCRSQAGPLSPLRRWLLKPGADGVTVLVQQRRWGVAAPGGRSPSGIFEPQRRSR
jgi:hypothetical protein